MCGDKQKTDARVLASVWGLHLCYFAGPEGVLLASEQPEGGGTAKRTHRRCARSRCVSRRAVFDLRLVRQDDSHVVCPRAVCSIVCLLLCTSGGDRRCVNAVCRRACGVRSAIS